MANKGKMLRRDFLKSLSMLPLTFSHSQGKPFFTPWLWKHPRRRSINPFFKNGKTILVVVEGRDVKKMLAAGIRAWPGITEALEDKKRIVIKPNVTAPQIYPITTDLKLLQELILKIKQLSSAKLTVCDSSSYAGLTATRIFSKLGYFDLGKTEKINVLSIDPTVGSDFVRVANPGWKRNPSILTNKIIQQADFVINVAIPKRHHAADFSCALKNNFGCTYDTFRMLAHKQLSGSKEKGVEFFDQSLVEFADAVRPDLTIVDARSLLIKSGPTFHPGKSEIKENVNRLILSGDMVAVDSYCADLMEKYDETFAKERRVEAQLNYAQTLNLGTKDLAQAEIIEVTE